MQPPPDDRATPDGIFHQCFEHRAEVIAPEVLDSVSKNMSLNVIKCRFG